MRVRDRAVAPFVAGRRSPDDSRVPLATRATMCSPMGRSSIDLYAHQIGVPITAVTSFDAYVGGCPTNVSVGTRRLGLRSALLTAVGDDQVGDFVHAFLDRERVETRFIPRKPGRRTSAVDPDDPAARHVSADVLPRQAAPTAPDHRRRRARTDRRSRVVVLTGTGLSHEPSRAPPVRRQPRARPPACRVVRGH